MLQPTPDKPTYVYDSRVSAIHLLRVNVKSLATEARLIRHEEMRCGPIYRDALANHRRGRLREESRYAGLSLAFIRGKPYRVVEAKTKTAPDAKRLFEKVRRFAYFVKNIEAITEWLAAK